MAEIHILPSALANMEHLLLDLEAQNLEEDQVRAPACEKLELWLKIEEIRKKQRKLLVRYPIIGKK